MSTYVTANMVHDFSVIALGRGADRVSGAAADRGSHSRRIYNNASPYFSTDSNDTSISGSLSISATDLHPKHITGSLSQATELYTAPFGSPHIHPEMIEFIELDALPIVDFL
jgi:hypothetical protein